MAADPEGFAGVRGAAFKPPAYDSFSFRFHPVSFLIVQKRNGVERRSLLREKLYPGELYMRPPFFLFVLSKRKNAPRGCKKEKPLGGREPISPPGPPACLRFSSITGELPGGKTDGLRDRVAAYAGLWKTLGSNNLTLAFISGSGHRSSAYRHRRPGR